MTEYAPVPPTRLDPRLRCVARQVPVCGLAADIGADHGRLSCYLLQSGRCQRMIVSDLSPESRRKARDLFLSAGVLDRVTLSEKDGLLALEGRPEAVIVSGMGGRLIARILRQDVDLQGARLVLGAQSEWPLVRDALQARGYRILSEELVRSGGRFYTVLSAEPGDQRLNERERAFGINLAAQDVETLLGYYRWQLSVTATWRGEKGRLAREWLQEELDEQERKRRDDL